MSVVRPLLAGLCAAAVASCGGGGGLPKGSGGNPNPIATPTTNAAAAVVNSGPAGTNAINTLYTSVTLCIPGSTTSCQTIGDIEIDTQSSGLRILASALTLALPAKLNANGSMLVECTQFADGFSWGPLVTADMTIAGESAPSLEVQVIGAANFTAIPPACSATGMSLDTVAAFGANGILGVGTPATDCGPACVASSAPGFYYACTSATNCVGTSLDLVDQLQNPATLFATDNNGLIIELPSVGAAGATTVTGAIVFGVDTASNNASGTATVLAVQTETSYLSVSFNGQTYATSFLDSGSNGLYFNDSALRQCTGSENNSGFYCPSSTQNPPASVLAYTASGMGGTEVPVQISIANAETLFSDDPGAAAFSNLAGIWDTTSTTDTFDLGLPFFYGRHVYEVYEGKSSSKAAGPYFAF
jgi:uncharacterized protein DUF3443